MKKYYLLLILLWTVACKQDRENIRCLKFPTTDKDSVCLNAYINPDTNFVNQALFNQKGDILIVFSGWQPDNSFLNRKMLSSPNVAKALQRFLIFEMMVDDRRKLNNGNNATIGERNMKYQISRFNEAVQPYYLIYSNGKIKCTGGYMYHEKDIIQFLDNCN
jgi:hypothetical protein